MHYAGFDAQTSATTARAACRRPASHVILSGWIQPTAATWTLSSAAGRQARSGTGFRAGGTGFAPGAGFSTGPAGRAPSSPEPIAAVGVLRAACELGLRIRGDLSHVGHDNTTITSIAPINLTSVDQAGHDIGATAARLLRERMDGRSCSVFTPAAPRLIIRNTTGPPGP